MERLKNTPILYNKILIYKLLSSFSLMKLASSLYSEVVLNIIILNRTYSKNMTIAKE
jgi:hypothetical protein